MIMTFDQLVQQILRESKALALPPKVQKIVPEIVDWIKSFCIDSLLQKDIIVVDVDKIIEHERSGADFSIDDQEEYKHKLLNATPSDPIMGTNKVWNVAEDPESDNVNLEDEIEVCLCTVDATAGGSADIIDNMINIYLPFGTSTDKSLDNHYDTAWLYHNVRHELMHLYDPTLHQSFTRDVNASRTPKEKKKHSAFIQQQNSAHQEIANSNFQQYHTRPGYRSGKIPIEFYPNLRTILDEHSISQLQSFLKHPEFTPLAPRYSEFVKHVFADPYLKRKFLEKIAQHIDFYTQRELVTTRKAIQEAQPGDIFAWNNSSKLDYVHRLKDTPKELSIWHDMLRDIDDNVYKLEFTNFEEFKQQGLDYVKNYSINPINFDLLKPLQRFKGKYIIMSDSDSGYIMFGKELY